MLLVVLIFSRTDYNVYIVAHNDDSDAFVDMNLLLDMLCTPSSCTHVFCSFKILLCEIAKLIRLFTTVYTHACMHMYLDM